jgi:hypothetical protein
MWSRERLGVDGAIAGSCILQGRHSVGCSSSNESREDYILLQRIIVLVYSIEYERLMNTSVSLE